MVQHQLLGAPKGQWQGSTGTLSAQMGVAHLPQAVAKNFVAQLTNIYLAPCLTCFSGVSYRVKLQTR